MTIENQLLTKTNTMKKLLILPIFALLFSINLQAQDAEVVDTSEAQNELKINMTNLIIFGFVDVGYERLLNEESSVGLSILFSAGDYEEVDFDYYRKFSATGFYRHFFSKKYAKGFFVEGFGMFHQYLEDDYIDFYSPNGDFISGNYEETEHSDFALGISAGGKFVTPRGFVAEVYLGIGRNIFRSDRNSENVVGRGGISLGYRF